MATVSFLRPFGTLVGCWCLLLTAGCTHRGAEADPAAVTEPVATPVTPSETVRLDDPSLLAGIPGDGPLTVAEVSRWLAEPTSLAPLIVELPAWLAPGAGQVKDLSDNSLSRAKIELGRQLFFDKRLSADGSLSCAGCHKPEHGFAYPRPLATGAAGEPGRRHPPTLLNRIMLAVGDDRQLWDGSALSVEAALLHTLADEQEMGADPSATITRLETLEPYRLQFAKLYGGVSWPAIGDAIGGFVRCLVTGDSPYDRAVQWRTYERLPEDLLAADVELSARFLAAQQAAATQPLSAAARRGERLFFGNRAWCSACHNGVNFTDEQFHNIGIGLDGPDPDLGRFLVTGHDADWAAFKTPTIRNAAATAPYMHDGSLPTLAAVVDWYAQGGRPNRNLDYRFSWLEPGSLSPQDKADLVAFIEACGGPLPQVETGRLPE
jgi:cytochrome c peroxidase